MSEPSAEPIFKAVFANDWHMLPPVFLTHYQVKPFSTDKILATGWMDIKVRGIFKLFRPFYSWLKMAPLINRQRIPCQVEYTANPESNHLKLTRTFFFTNAKSYSFHSTMIPAQHNIVFDRMHFGFCWKIKYHYAHGAVHLEHRGYALYFFKHFIPLPITFLLGKIEAYEYALDEQRFAMYAHIKHKWFGILYSYQGEFSFQS